MIKMKNKKNSNAAMRVKIANDVLSQLTAGNLTPQTGTWVAFNDVHLCQLVAQKTNKVDEIPSAICKIVKAAESCEACALGAIFMSAIRKSRSCGDFSIEDEKWSTYGDLELQDYIFTNLDPSPLTKYFPIKMLQQIENCFEGGQGMHSIGTGEMDRVIAELYHETFCGDRERMRAIMNNIVRNGGNFKPVQDINPQQLAEARENVRSLR